MNRRALLAGLGTRRRARRDRPRRAAADRRRRRATTRARASARPPPRRPSRRPATSTPARAWSRTRAAPATPRELAKIVNDAADPLAAVEGITAAAYADQTGFLLANCHGIMHTVAREYALRTHLTLAKLMDNLPQTNDPGCSAGYAHGLVTAVAPEIEKAGPTVAIKLCAKSETRYQRYSCTHGFGHAFMRLNNDNDRAGAADVPAARLAAPRPIAPRASTTTTGSRSTGSTPRPSPRTPSPSRARCAAPSPPSSCGPCWYRAFVETAAGTRTESAADVEQPVRRPRGPAAPGVRHRLDRDRPARPAQPARDLRLAGERRRTSPPASAGPRSRT